MDTFVTVVSDVSPNTAEQTVNTSESIFSKTIETSDIYKINSQISADVSEECADVLAKAAEISSYTNGAFNPCMGNIVSLWDITGKKHIPSNDEITEALKFCRYDGYDVSGTLVSKKYDRTQIDLGACVKGYTAEKAIKDLKKAGAQNAMVNIGGNVAVTGSAEGRGGYWRVAIKNPFFPDEIAGYIDCTDTIISVSGDYERYFEYNGKRYHHIFDSSTGYPAESGIKSSAVIASDGIVSDALSTAIFCMGVKKAFEFYDAGIYDFEAVIFTDDGFVYLTDGIKDRFVLGENARFNESRTLCIAER